MDDSIYKGLVGLPYAEDGRGPDAYNCGELCLEVFRRAGIPVPTPEYTTGTPMTAKRVLELNDNDDWQRVGQPFREFDLVVLRDEHHIAGIHCGTFVEPDRLLHVEKEAGVVCVGIRPMKERIVGVYRHRCLN